MRAEGLEPSQAFWPNGFSYLYGFRRLGPAFEELGRVCGLDYPFTVSRNDPGLRCCPSSLYTFPAEFRRAWLGIAMLRFPRLWAVLHRRFPGEHSSSLKSAASAIPPRPHAFIASTYDK